jgi:hypothetical protein
VLASVHARRSNGPGQNSIALTAPFLSLGLDEVKTTRGRGEEPMVWVLKTEIKPYWVATARYWPDLEKHTAKLPFISDLSDSN